jgi:flagellar basal-body rod protein FlgF
LVRGIYTAAAGALVADQQADTIANNLANVDTAGFKATLLQVESAPDLQLYRIQTDPGRVPGRAVPGVPVMQPVGPLGTGALVYDTPDRFTQGPLERTGNPLDVAIGGVNAFFAVQTPVGVRYTRDGRFALDPNGFLVTQQGYRVLGQAGPIRIPAQSPITIASDGTITQNGAQVDRLALVSFGNLTALRKQGDDLFVDTGTAGPAAAAGATVEQGFLEKSNTNVVRSMVDLIVAERWFEANQRMIKTQDDATRQAIENVGQTPQA